MDARPLTGKALRSLQCEPASITAYEGAVRSGKTIASLLDWVRFIRQGPAGPLLMTGRNLGLVVFTLSAALHAWRAAAQQVAQTYSFGNYRANIGALLAGLG